MTSLAFVLQDGLIVVRPGDKEPQNRNIVVFILGHAILRSGILQLYAVGTRPVAGNLFYTNSAHMIPNAIPHKRRERVPSHGAQECRGATMMHNDVAALAAKGESETLEFKQTTGGRSGAAKTVCAFLNQRSGGMVLFGVTPDGHVVGQQVGQDTLEDLSATFQHIEPSTYPNIDHVPVKGGLEVIVVSTREGALRPYTYKGKAYRRVGSTTLAMSAEESNRVLFERLHNEQRWENQPAGGWSVDDLDSAEIRRTTVEAVQSNRLDGSVDGGPADTLRGLGLLRDGELLRAAVVLFGNTGRIASEMPQCLLRVARFRGSDRTEFLDNRQFRGNAFTLLTHAERFVREMLPITGRFEQDSFKRIDKPLYPFLAVREALANAFCHRDYSIGGGSVGVAIYDDRLEVTSSGSLHFGLTPAKLFSTHESIPWNPLIADAFFRRGIIEQWAMGVSKMVRLASESGLPRPEIEDDGMCVTVRFRHGRRVLKQIKQSEPVKLRREVLALLDRTGKGMARREIIAQMDAAISNRQVRRILEELRDGGLAVSVGHGRGARWISRQVDAA